jgi:hypothetical protein
MGEVYRQAAAPAVRSIVSAVAVGGPSGGSLPPAIKTFPGSYITAEP